MSSISNPFRTLGVIVFLSACTQSTKQATTNPTDQTESKKQIAAMLDSFNVAAANADYTKYFNFYADDATFIGTDATENWDKKKFMVWAKPFFDKKTTWNFSSIQRNIYFSKTGEMAWFDELLSTQMKICRGSGVVVKLNNEWKVQQYVLSMTIPNAQVDEIVSIKSAVEDSLMKQLAGK
jgi:ketosteroid isomerase-like protein